MNKYDKGYMKIKVKNNGKVRIGVKFKKKIKKKKE